MSDEKSPELDIESIKGIRQMRHWAQAMIRKIESLENDKRNNQVLGLLRLVARLLEDKEHMLSDEQQQTTIEINDELDDLTDMVNQLMTLDNVTREKR